MNYLGQNKQITMINGLIMKRKNGDIKAGIIPVGGGYRSIFIEPNMCTYRFSSPIMASEFAAMSYCGYHWAWQGKPKWHIKSDDNIYVLKKREWGKNIVKMNSHIKLPCKNYERKNDLELIVV